MGVSTNLLRVFQKNTADDYLNAALETEAWLKTLEIKTEHGKIWRRSPEVEDAELSSRALFTDKCMYGGSSGIGIYFIRLYEVTGDDIYLKNAQEVAAHIVATYAGIDSYKKIPEVESGRRPAGWTIGSYNGPVGESFFLELLYRHLPKTEYLDFIRRVADDFLESALQEEAGNRWSTESDIPGDGGIIAFLVLVYHRTQDQKYLDAATSAGDYLATKAVDAPSGGKYWNLFDITRIGFQPDTTFANFTHGTAGAGWVFALLYKDTHKEAYLRLAKEAIAFLQGIAVGDSEGALVPHLYHPVTGPSQDQFYLSTCGGPVGTVLLFKLVYEITGETAYLDWVRYLSRGIIRTGAPEINSWGYWQNSCLCCGSPGLLEHFVTVYELTKDEEFLEYARRTANVLLGDSYITDGKRRWYGAWTRSQPTDVKSYTGLYVGSSGAAAALLRLYAAEKGIKVSGFFEYQF